jgi:uncharacterized protein (DUF1778 family)
MSNSPKILLRLEPPASPVGCYKQLLISSFGGKLAPTRQKLMRTLDEEKSRITARVPSEMREALEEAARLQGATVNQFVVQAAYQEAQRILERETVIRLSQRGAQKVFALLENPPKPNKQLKGAVKAYHELVRV